MNTIVLVKQIPDVAHIPEEAWDREKGTLRRGMLEPVFNPLDLHALTLACRMRDFPLKGRVVCLTMGPHQARELLEESIARGADEAVLLTDAKFAGADTPATAYALACAVRKIAREIFRGEDYAVVAGMQSMDGDTAQVPPQVAEELGIEHVAYARAVTRSPDGELDIQRIGPKGIETVRTLRLPVLLTVTRCTEPLFRSFHRARSAGQGVRTWSAADVSAAEDRVGFKGSRTWVVSIAAAAEERAEPCAFPKNIDALLDAVERDYARGRRDKAPESAGYALPAGKKPRYSGEVWVMAEAGDGVLTDVSLELVGKARELARSLGVRVAAVLAGDKVDGLAKELFSAGADKVCLACHPLLKDFLPVPYTRALASLVREFCPQIVLFGATPLGRELAPRVAYAVGAGLTADCTGLEISDHVKAGEEKIAVLKQTRPALGGNIMATIITRDSSVQMATVRPGVFPRIFVGSKTDGEVVMFEPPLKSGDICSRIVWTEPVTPRARLDEADIVIAGGRGMRSKANFEKFLVPLAGAMGQWLNAKVEIAGSRTAVEEGLVGHDRQVGQTGQNVSPKLYVAVGVSGAVQHVTGMQNAGLVLSINRDAHARMFSYSDYGAVGDWEEIVPELTERILKRAQGRGA